jgi:hypothetical protein
VNAHLYRFAIHDTFASLTTGQYYAANGAINLHYWLRFAEFFGRTIDVYATERYVIDHYSGLSLACQRALDALMDN